jgi:diguanylate cyclase (GGDEF)-like protein
MRRGRRSGRGAGEDRAWTMTAYLAAIIALGFVVAASGVVYAHFWHQDNAHRKAVDRLMFQAQHAADATADLIAYGPSLADRLAADEGLRRVLRQGAGCTLTFAEPGAFPTARLDLVSTSGTVVCTSKEAGLQAQPRVHAGSPWLVKTLSEGKPQVRPASRDAVADEEALVISVPVADAGGKPLGALAIFYHVKPLADALTRSSAGSADVRFAVADPQTNLVVSAPGGGTSVLTRTAALPSSVRSGTVGDPDDSGFDFGSADIRGTPWRVFAGEPSANALAGTEGALWRQLLFGLLALLILTGAIWRLDRSVARPLQSLTAAARLATRNLDSGRVTVQGTSETRVLGQAFNQMLDVAGGHAAQLSHQATHDALTGLPNRTVLMERARAALAEGPPVAVLTLGMTRFRLVNDGLGHDVGDKVLKEIAGRLAGALRELDTLARFGSDEFVILAPGLADEEALAYAARLQVGLSTPFRVGLGELALSAVVGIATGTAESTSAARLVRESDTAMRHAKREGITAHLFDEDLQTVARTNLVIERELHEALAADELVVVYQPLVDIASGVVVAAEALVRWQHPQRGLLSPLEFVPLAEQTGQIVAVGEAVLRKACRQAAEWASAGDALVVGVNVAAAQLRTGTFPQLVAQVLSETGLDARQLCIEVTESSLVTTTEGSTDDLERLRALGVHLAIDDFGTGYSSLSYLHDLPCDELKIDKSFVDRLETGESHLVDAIMRMALALDLTVVAEGIESEGQLQALAAMGCQLGQGYLFSRPVPAAEFRDVMARRHVVKDAGLAGIG